MRPEQVPGSADSRGERPNLTEAVYEQLIDLLIRGELRPGDIVTERKMAESLKASRTPIREALSRLESQGLVYKQASRGVTVSPFTAEAFIEIINVRQILEAEAAWLAAGEIPAETLERIRRVLNETAAKPNPTLAEIWAADDLLHGEIAAASNNKLLATMIRDLRRRTHVFNVYRNGISRPFTSNQNGNHMLLEAIESGDRDRAREAMSQHLAQVKTAIIERLSGVKPAVA
ncbi:GntR family transcriptional regulator [Pelagibacterium lacus]|uniref:GntR family transcriptional regulator n=1 Tax=Pelagibacterium lacus TaxID=2282655 RepID=A0A369WBR5_9HYPH|nr:GntR family transcriptional regulator [Pelagibacterium lacus]RDE09551.1 GntR family transcriptional regulator [Pelagibacterium lacus]